jgi:hypothetical protein
MTRDPFDLEKVRRNWARAVAPRPEDAAPERFAHVKPPPDLRPEARALLERIRRLALLRFAEREGALTPFLDDASMRLEHLSPDPPPAGGAPDEAAGPGAAEDPGATRDELQKVLYDLEDLFEVFAEIGR